MKSLAKKSVKLVLEVLCNVCLIGKFMRWLYERANHIIDSKILPTNHSTSLLLGVPEVLPCRTAGTDVRGPK